MIEHIQILVENSQEKRLKIQERGTSSNDGGS